MQVTVLSAILALILIPPSKLLKEVVSSFTDVETEAGEIDLL